MNRLFLPTILGAAIALTFLGFTTDLSQVKAQSAKATFRSPQPPKTLPEKGNRRRGSADRGKCSPAKELPPLTALVPEFATSEQSGASSKTVVWGQTVSTHPTLWFYVPYYRQQGDFPVEFVLQDSERNDVLMPISFNLPKTPGVIRVQIPFTAPPLEVGKPYLWSFKVKCDSPARAVSGWVQRINLNPTVMKQIEAAKPQQQAALYADNGVWYDALTVLGKELLANPKDAEKDWKSLLQEIELNDIALETTR